MLRKIEELKKDLEALDKERIKAEGAFEQAMASLKDLGYGSIEEAADSLEAIRDDLRKANAEAGELITQIENKYADFIEPTDKESVQ